MNTLSSFITQVQTLSTIINDYHYIYRSNDLKIDEIRQLKASDCALQTDSTSIILTATEQGFERDDLYFPVHGKTSEELRSVFGKCRYILGDLDEIDTINVIARGLNKPGYLESIALFVTPKNHESSSGAFDESTLSLLSKRLKAADALAVRGVFFLWEMKPFQESASTLKSIYELVKSITSLLPCRISYFNIGSCIDLFSQASFESSEDALSLIQLANLVSYLNTTSFYSRLLIS